MDKVRIGVIGLGWFGEIHCDAISAVPTLELAALCTRTEARLEELAAKHGVTQTYTDYNALLANPEIDAVSVVTMWDQHTAPTLAALAAGKHVFWKSRWPRVSRTARRSAPRRAMPRAT